MKTEEFWCDVVAYYEQLFRERTPARDVREVLALQRVNFTDLLDKFPTLAATDRIDLAPRIKPVLRRLKREFPHERWD